MTAAMSDNQHADGWTVDDLERFPDDKVRRELLDGVLLVLPSASNSHQIISMRLGVALDETCPAEMVVTQDVDVRFSERRSFAPDVLVVTDAAAGRTERPFMSHEVLLAVEIVSPTSVGMDRITKPAIYAGAGIPCYWRVETDGGITVHTYRLDPEKEIYVENGSFTDVIVQSEPWEIEIPVARLTPKHLRRA